MNATLVHPDHDLTVDARPLVLVPRPLGIDDARDVLRRAAAHIERHDLDAITRDAILANV